MIKQNIYNFFNIYYKLNIYNNLQKNLVYIIYK